MFLLEASSSMTNARSKVNNIHMPSTSSSGAGFQGIYSVSCNFISDVVNTWIVDSGATDHACYSIHLFTSYKKENHIPRTIGSAKLAHGLYYLEGQLILGLLQVLFVIPSLSLAHLFGIFVLVMLLSLDLWGPYSTPTLHGHKYFLTIVDDFSRYTWIMLLKGKHEAASQIQSTDVNKTKLHPRATKCIFLGYKSWIKGYVVLNIGNYQTSISKNVLFEETVFPYITRKPIIQSWEYLDSTKPHSQKSTTFSPPPIDHILPLSNPQPSLDSPPFSDSNTTIPPPSSPPPKRKSTRLKLVLFIFWTII
ncbi:peptide transporter PTR2, partial [Trifolium medium]|nr:peptide transporter PTR2 [Trifolium medium]